MHGFLDIKMSFGKNNLKFIHPKPMKKLAKK